MKKLKYLNNYAGIGGNRKLIPNEITLNGVTYKIEVVAVENNKEIAKIYQDNFPDDIVFICDAHRYLLEKFKHFDFIWSSYPCQTHSKARFWASKGGRYKPKYPDMKLYEEILFLENFAKCKYVVENVVGYYKALKKPQEIGKHYFWANFNINIKHFQRKDIRKVQVSNSVLSNKKLSVRKDAILRSVVNPELGLHIFKCAFKEQQKGVGDFTLTPS